MKRLIVIAATLLALTGASAMTATASSASVCQPNGTGCTKAGTYPGPNAVINSNFFGVEVVWTKSVVQPYSSGGPLNWTAYMTYTNTTSASITLGCPGGWTNASYVSEHMSGGSGDDGTVPAGSTTCSQNPGLVTPVAPGGTYTFSATFHNVAWPGSAVAIQWGNAGTSPSVNPFTTIANDTNNNWAGYLAQTGNTSTQVNGTFVQPQVTCAAGESSSAGFWVGITNSTGGGTLAQDGTSAFCYNGAPGYYLWWETVGRSTAQGGDEPVPVLNANPPAICNTSPKFTGTTSPTLQQLYFLVHNNCVASIKPGYTINLQVLVQPGSYAAFFAYIPQTGFHLNTSQTFSNVIAGGSEWIAETQGLGIGLSNFGKVTFSYCYVYTGTGGTLGQPINSFNDLQLTLVYGYLGILTAASPGPLGIVTGFSNGAQDGFTVTWRSHG